VNLSALFKGGPKLYYWPMFYGVFLLLLSGIFLWFPQYIPRQFAAVRGVMIPLHEAAELVTSGVFLVPYSTTATTAGCGDACLGLDTSSPVVPSGDRRAGAEGMTIHEARIARADHLAGAHPGAAPLLRFYAQLARFQQPIFSELRSKGETDLRALMCYFPALIKLVARAGTELLADFAVQNLSGSEAQSQLLVSIWEGGQALDPAGRFYARVLLQPYAECLALRGDLTLSHASSACPFCSSRPVAGVWRGEGDGGKRWLLCSLCGTEWQYRRVVCPGCGEENKDKLPIFQAADFPAARVEACDTCRTYLKSIDLTKDGHAIPMVDEMATVALSIWAEEQDYVKLETNLLGM
jgi:FdhE protein